MAEIQNYIAKIANKESLTEEEAARAFQIIMMGGSTPAQIAALLMGLRLKGETVDELTGAARAMRAKCVKIAAPMEVLDTCGTGGDNSGSYNISTAAALVVAACGVPVAKHGNRSISSKSGSAEVLKELGVNVDADKSLMEQALAEYNICFLMAPKFHTAMRHVAPIRQELGIRTIFNIVGPLANPASAKYQLLGVYSEHLIEPLAEVLKRLGTERAWVVHGSDGLDEITTTGPTKVAELKEGKITTFDITPQQYGIAPVAPVELEGDSPQHNALELKRLLSGKGNLAYRDIVVLNAAACLLIEGRVNSVEEGIRMASEVLASGAAMETLSHLVEVSNRAV